MSQAVADKTDPGNTSSESAEPTIRPDEKWLIRDCEVYKDEYKECTSFRGRFHQYFIFGELLDCKQWKRDYDNCCKWENSKDVKAAVAVIESEKQRRLERLRAHYRNDTWKKRDAPPADWDKPLPEWMAKRDENTYLALKAKEMREGKTEETSDSLCTIM
ncbi:PREDICTED: UPF0545 protein C22orf39 homolog [Papilio xuthus]|uniref:Synaptic plasticity regulator PANTS n=1 Tax=Papilio xuthus TaxID=66420 RepID=A0A194PG35_PAPXU|nr:PREDICTED: UPF0545 protein C22orf39 homolog [Papilio xuthus]KPI91664.1 UPF0545 protein C22orf39-like [Papilio xuthus]